MSIFEKLVNKSILINSSGKIQAGYNKINLFDVNVNSRETHRESHSFIKGNKIVITKVNGVKIVGIPNLCRTIPNTASMLYSNNVTNFVTVLVDDGKLVINQDEQVLTGDEGGISAGYGGILIAEDGKIHENHTKLMEAMK